MGRVFRPKYRRRLGRDPDTGETRWGEYQEADCWYIAYRDAEGRRRTLKGFKDRRLTERLLHRKEQEAGEIRAGVRHPVEEHLERDIRLHIDDYVQHLRNKGAGDKHVGQISYRLRQIADDIRAVRLRDLTAELVEGYLARRRSLPRKEGGLSAQTSNHYLRQVKSFCNWLVAWDRLLKSPLRQLTPVNVAVDRRHRRRCLSRDDFLRLITATFAAPDYGDTRRFSGPDRAVLYLLAAYTGLRAAELLSLTTESLELGSSAAAVTIEAGAAKNKRWDVLPLHPDVADQVRAWVAGKPPGRLWPEHDTLSRLIARDLKRAGIPYRDQEGKVFDFHALRGQFASELILAGVPLAEAQRLLRHSDPRLTQQHYVRVEQERLAEQVGKLPRLRLHEPEEQSDAG